MAVVYSAKWHKLYEDGTNPEVVYSAKWHKLYEDGTNPVRRKQPPSSKTLLAG
ncbi:MAG: hypothetical protein ACYS1A_01945 [Planctomycetota bacterium]